MAERQWTIDERLAELPCKAKILLQEYAGTKINRTAINAEDIQTHMKELLSQVNIRILVAGNMYKDVGGLLSILGLIADIS